MKLNFFENVQEAKIPTTFKSCFEAISPTGQNSRNFININAHNVRGSERNISNINKSDSYISRDRIRGQLLLTETKTNGKRVWDGVEMETCVTKKMRPN